jgi:RimJ/RimL family protein N-acetyltransferase
MLETMNDWGNYWEGERVRLRAIEPNDAAFFFELKRDSERNRLLDFLSPPDSRAALEHWALERSRRAFEGDAFQWLIETLAGEPVGSIVTHTCNPRNGTFSYALDITRAQRRRGYAREAVLMVLRYYFEELRYQKVHVATRSDNDATIALHRSLGFEHEGTQRRMVFQQGRYFDLLLFGLNAEALAASRALNGDR